MSEIKHPGALLREKFTELGWNEHKAVQLIGLGRTKVRYFLAGKGRCTPEIAVHICKVFGGKPIDWLFLQATYDLKAYQLNLSSPK